MDNEVTKYTNKFLEKMTNNLDNFGRYNINQDIIKFISEIEKLCIEILSNNKESLIKIADLLLKKETIDYNDLYNAVNHTLENSVKLEIVDEIYPNDTLSNILNMFKLI